MNYSYELQKQSEDRIHRIGQNKKCTYYSIIAQNTVDELIHKAVNKKADLNKTILEHLKNGDQYEGTTSAKGFAKAAV
jgi:SNF2 family DNA or RNA helicase